MVDDTWKADALAAVEAHAAAALKSIAAYRVGWGGPGFIELIRDAEAARNAIPEGDATVFGLYHGGEAFCGVYAVGAVEPAAFVKGALDHLAREASQPVGLGEARTWIEFHHLYGEAVVPLIADVLRTALASARTEWRRKETTIDDDERGEVVAYAAIDDDTDNRFDEAGYSHCKPTDDFARQIVCADLDSEGLFGELATLVETRSNLARFALRGGLPAAAEAAKDAEILKGMSDVFALDPDRCAIEGAAMLLAAIAEAGKSDG